LKINNRYYLDFNASSPFASSVIDFLAKGDFFYGNPSSVHSTGKRSRRAVSEVEQFLRDTYSLPETKIVFFHSGATEGLNSVLQGSAKTFFRRDEKALYMLGAADHSCIVNQEEDLKDLGHEVSFYGTDKNGAYPVDEIIEKIKAFDGPCVLNYTWVNNETGIINSLDHAVRIKKETGAYVVVDGVQSVGKVEDWNKISSELDAYTFSGHKFGSMKGVGWTFMCVNFPYAPLLRGGGQQGGIRSGTENTDGIYTLKLALEELIQSQKDKPIKIHMDNFRKELTEKLQDSGELVGDQSSFRSSSTFYIILNKQKADITLIAFDLDQLDVSSGSACSSGALEPSRVLTTMGYNETEAKSALRISFPFAFSEAEYLEMKEKIFKILDRFV
jgi:cysteine desulfurase